MTPAIKVFAALLALAAFAAAAPASARLAANGKSLNRLAANSIAKNHLALPAEALRLSIGGKGGAYVTGIEMPR